MIRNFLRLVLFIPAFLAMPATAWAQCAAAACTNALVTRLYVTVAGEVLVETNGNEASLDCTPRSNVFVTLSMTQPLSKEVYSLLLSAQLQQTPVTIRIDNGSQGCTINYVVLGKQD